MNEPFQVWHDLSASEFADLVEDVRVNGVVVPVVLDQHGRVLDGHHRVKAAEQIGLAEYPTTVLEISTDEEGRSVAYRLNAHRRHSTREQKRAALERSLLADPGLSDREHAKRVGVSDKTAGAVRSELEAGAEIPHLTEKTGRDGKAYRKPLTSAFDEATSGVTKAIDRLARLTTDNRFARNADQVAARNRSDLIRARDALSGVIDLLTQGEA